MASTHARAEYYIIIIIIITCAREVGGIRDICSRMLTYAPACRRPHEVGCTAVIRDVC